MINEYFDKIFVLNLAHRTDRKKAMQQKLNSLNINAEFVEAVNGYSSDNLAAYQQYLKRPIGAEGCHPMEKSYGKKLIDSPGAWGCLLTFRNILEKAKSEGLNRILCLEDDVLFHKEFETRFEETVQKISNDWKLLYLGASQYVWRTPDGLSYPTSFITKSFPRPPFYYPKATDGAFSIGIHCSVFRHLINEIDNMNCAFDSGALRSVNVLFPKKCLVLMPNLVIADVSESDIREGKEQEDTAQKLHWNLTDYDFSFQEEKVSVIMPAYNAKLTIEKSIRSILAQTYRHLELIVVDDGSIDGTSDVVRNIMQEDTRVQLLVLEKNVGVGGARNAGIQKSLGDIIAFQDADDVSLPQRIEYQVLPIREKKLLFTVSRILRSRCSSEEFNLKDWKKTLTLVKKRRKRDWLGRFLYKDQYLYGLVTTVYHRKVFEQFGLFERLRFGEDMEFLERVLHFVANKTFTSQYNGHTFLNHSQSLNNVFEKIDELLYLCPKMNENNLTKQFEKKRGEHISTLQNFRQKYQTKTVKDFPKLN